MVDLPRDPRADAYPMPAVPDGWYAVLRGRELRPGKVVSLLPHEKGMRALRRWYAQFYPEPAFDAEQLTRR